MIGTFTQFEVHLSIPPWTGHVISLSLGFSLGKMGIRTVLRVGLCGIWGLIREHLQKVPELINVTS